jgi:Ca-activated chloride channel family protein
MSFESPQLLWLLLAVPALVAAYLWALNRRKHIALRYANLSAIKEAIGPGQRLRRHIPPLLFLVATIAAIVAIARPSAVVTLPSDQRTIIMAMDVSLSMRAQDVQPSRIQAAQAAAKAFVQDQPADVRIGIVTFAGTASVAQPPTRNRDDLVAAIDRFELQRHTAIGSGIVVSLATIFPEEGIDLESMVYKGGLRSGTGKSPPLEKPAKVEPKPFKPVAPGTYQSAAIILLTDGRRTTGPDSLDAARMAAERGVRIYTVGFGTPGGGTASFDGYSMFMAYDEETLKAIAELTKAEYFHAATAADLAKIYQTLNTRFVLEKKETEVSALAAAAAAVLLLAAGLLSLAWTNRFA